MTNKVINKDLVTIVCNICYTGTNKVAYVDHRHFTAKIRKRGKISLST